MTEIQDGALITLEVMGGQVHAIGKGYKTPFRRSGHILPIILCWVTLNLAYYAPY